MTTPATTDKEPTETVRAALGGLLAGLSFCLGTWFLCTALMPRDPADTPS
jgi:hypothetical protein